MALAGKWNKARNENGEAFLTALGVDKAALERAANAACGKSQSETVKNFEEIIVFLKSGINKT